MKRLDNFKLEFIQLNLETSNKNISIILMQKKTFTTFTMNTVDLLDSLSQRFLTLDC